MMMLLAYCLVNNILFFITCANMNRLFSTVIE